MMDFILTSTTFEVIAVMLIFIGLINERKLIRFENKVLRKIFKRKTKSKSAFVEYSFAKNSWIYKPNRKVRSKNSKDYFCLNTML